VYIIIFLNFIGPDPIIYSKNGSTFLNAASLLIKLFDVLDLDKYTSKSWTKL